MRPLSRRHTRMVSGSVRSGVRGKPTADLFRSARQRFNIRLRPPSTAAVFEPFARRRARSR